MRSTIILSTLAALAVANPLPQQIDFSAIDALPKASVSAAPVDVASQSVSVKPSAAATSIAAAKVTATTVPSDAAVKRDLTNRAACDPQPLGKAPNSNPDTANAFLADPEYNAVAGGASTPSGYKLAFSGLQGSSQTTSYLGYKTLDKYDTEACASYCDQQEGCIAFNIYFERDPTLEPAPACNDPASTINYKCVKWGVEISDKTATNVGQWRQDFRVVISGSNGYNKLALPNPAPGYQGPVALPGAINAPLDPVNNKDTYMGYKFFSFNDVQTFANGVIACTSACTKQTQYNAEHPPSTGKPAVCNQVVVYILNDNGSPQGIYCSMYTESWDPKYATNVGQYRGSDYWSVTSAFSFITDSYAAKYKPICALDGCPADSYKGGNNGGYGQDPVKTTPKCKSKRSKKAL